MRIVRHLITLAVLALGVSVAPAHATTIAINTAGALSATFAPGQSVTTTAGGPWDAITFNWFAPSGAPTAAGTLFLLDQAYAGTAAALSSSTTGFIASSTGISSGVYLFGPTVVLQPLTQYFFYANANLTTLGSAANPYAGGSLYVPGGNVITNPFVNTADQDANFRLEGSLVQTAPEPATLTLFGLGLTGMVARRWRQRKTS